MSKRILFHGSSDIIEKPVYGGSKDNNDYGNGFYCTESIELAKEWACNEGVNGYANCYEIDTKGLNILNLSSDEYSVLNWIAILLDNRIVRLSMPMEERGRAYIINNFLPDYKKCDAIIGYRADDSYFSYARSFLSNTMSVRQLESAMKLGKLGEQFVIKSQKAYKALKFTGQVVADNEVYYRMKKAREIEARAAFIKELEAGDIDGVFIRDIMKEGMKADDKRLQ